MFASIVVTALSKLLLNCRYMSDAPCIEMHGAAITAAYNMSQPLCMLLAFFHCQCSVQGAPFITKDFKVLPSMLS